jgi:hypothetical protein
MGSMTIRAGTVPRGTQGTGPSALRSSCITGAPISTLPNLPPQQPIDHQLQISGEILLARTPGHRVRTQHKKATARK